ncbi:MAG: hypothetical protein KC615_14290 [Anaerolineae bacterium]|nr:hypothetical protein [Anaerolineae bacterium]
MRKLLLLSLIVIAFCFSSTNSLGQDSTIRMVVDGPTADRVVFQRFAVIGWAFDRNAGVGYGSGIDRIEVYEGTQCAGEVIGQGGLTVRRADVLDYFSLDDSYELSGYNITVEVSETGPFTFTVCAYSSVNVGELLQVTRDITLIPAGMLLSVDYLYDDGPIVENAAITGWAIDARAGDSNGPGIEEIRVFLGETCEVDALANTTLSERRPTEIGRLNLDASYLIAGYSLLLDDLPVGEATLTVCAISSVDATVQSETFNLTVYESDTMPLWPLILVIVVTFSLLFVIVISTNRRSGGESIWSRPWVVALYIGLSLIPAIIVMLYIHRYAVNMPFWDEWLQSVSAYLRTLTDEVNLKHLWKLHNEHRTFVPGIYGLAIAQITSVNILALIFLNFILAIMIWTLVYNLYRCTSESEKHYFILLPAAAMLFAMLIWPRWIDSRPIRLLSAIVYFLISLWVIVAGGRNLRTVFIAGIFATLSSLSFFTGNYTWFVVGGAMLFLRYFKIRYYILWIVMAASVLVPYVVEFTNANTITRKATGPDIGQLFEFVLFFIGSPLAQYRLMGSQTEPILLGALGIGTTIILGIYNLYMVHNGFRKSLPWLAIIGWVVLNAATAGYGRISQFGLTAASSVRYMIYGLLFWTALFALISIALFEPKQASSERWKRQLYRFRHVVNVFLVGFMVFLSYWYVNAYQATVQGHHLLDQVVELRATSGCLYDFMNASDSCLDNVLGVPDNLRRIAYRASQDRVSWLEVDSYPLALQYANKSTPEEASIDIDGMVYDALLLRTHKDTASWTIFIPDDVQTTLQTTLILPEGETEDLQYGIIVIAHEDRLQLPLQVSSESILNRLHHHIEADLTPFAGEEITLKLVILKHFHEEIMWLVPTIQYADE